jgi:uncharacterized repeat protein (TIGR01451 family)
MSTDNSSSTRSKAGLKWLLPLVSAFVVFLMAASGIACEVATDKVIYRPGEMVTITGKVWQPQEWVKLTIANTAGTRQAMEFDVTAGSDGTFTSRELIVQEYDRDQMLLVMARGSSGKEAMVAFRVGVAPGALKCSALTPVAPTFYGVASGQTVSCSIEGATDLSAAQRAGTAPVEVIVKRNQGNVPATVTSVSGTTIFFQWTAPAGTCDSAIVSYGPIKACDPNCGKCTTFPTAGNEANSRIISNGSVIAPAGFKSTGLSCGVPKLVVEKLPKNGAFTQGSQVSFTIIVRNTGTTSASSVMLNDQLPGNGGLVWQSATTTQGTCVNPIAGNALSCSLGTIAAQGSVTVTVRSTATTPAAACQCQPNAAAVATAYGGIRAEDYGFLTCTPPSAPPQLKVVKSPKNGTFTSGSQLSYVIKVSNPAPAGSQPARNVMLTDQLPGFGGLSWPFVSSSAGSCSLANNYLSCSLGDIAAGTTVTVTVNSTTTTPASACQAQPNCVAVATAEGGLRAEDWGSMTCTAPCPQLRVVKTPDNGTFVSGSQLRYTIVVSNPGTAPATNVRLTDTLPINGGLTWTSVTPASCSLSGNMLNCMLGTIPAGGSVTVTVSSPATTPPAACQPQPNPAAIATADNGLTAQDSGSMNCTPPAVPQLRVVKTPDNGSFAQGAQAVFTIVVSNPGTATAMNVMLTDTLPNRGGLTWTSVTPSTCSIVGNVLSCSLGNIAAGASRTVVVASPATTPATACQAQPNPAATATADGGLTASDSGSLICTPPARPQLRVVKTPDNGSFVQGAQVRFTIVVSNPGNATAMNVRLTDTLPNRGGLTWTSVTPSTCSISGNMLSCSFGNLAAGTSRTVVVSSTATTPATACQAQPNPAATATADGGLTASDSGSLTCTPPPPAPGLSIIKTPSTTTPAPGQQVTYTYTVRNTGNVTLTNIRVIDNNGTPNNPADDFTVGTIATLAPGATATLTAVRIPSNTSIAARLGVAGPSFFTILSLGGDAAHNKAGIYCSIATVNGNLGIVQNGFFHNADKCIENGDFYKGAAVLYQDLGGQLYGSIIVNDPLLLRAREHAFAASNYFASLPVTPSVQAQFPADGKFHGITRTITGQPGLNVVNLPAFSLSKGNIVFTGPPGTQFVLNIAGTFGIVTGTIRTAGGVGPYDIIYNITNRSASVGTDKYEQDISGILLAPFNEIHAMYALFWRGSIIGAYNQETIKLNYGTTVGAPNPPRPIVTNRVTATTVYGTATISATATSTVTIQ